MLIVDAANVVGSRPTGWWRDRPGAAARLCSDIVRAVDTGQLSPPVVVVLEGGARRGAGEREDAGIRVVHATGSGDDTIVAMVGQEVTRAERVNVVTADRALQRRVRALGAQVMRPRWLLSLIA